MEYNFYVKPEERSYLRELAKKQREYAKLPVMEERKNLWYAHNSLKGKRPIIVMEIDSFIDDIFPDLKCETPAAKEIERNLLFLIINHELINDDKVIPPYYTIYWKISIKEFGIDIKKEYARDSKGRTIGYSQQHPITDLKRDLPRLQPSIFRMDKEYTFSWKNFVEEIFGDILPVKIKNDSLHWHIAPSMKVVDLMGLENMMYAMADYPEQMHELYRFLQEDILSFVKWQEKEGLLVLNNGNDYAGAGSYGFTTELPGEDYKESRNITAKDLWVNMNSQETVGISPAMFREFIFPYYRNLAEKFGLVYFGCCEPVHDIWNDCISLLPGLRKVSVSPWCNEEFMGEILKANGVVYSRKPNPNFLGVEKYFDEEAFRRHIIKTLNAANGCNLEFIFRDVYTLSGDISKPGRSVSIVRELIDKMWH
jgi:hypothetical protein